MKFKAISKGYPATKEIINQLDSVYRQSGCGNWSLCYYLGKSLVDMATRTVAIPITEQCKEFINDQV